MLRDGERLHVTDGHILVLGTLGGEHVVVTDIAVALVMLGDHDFLLADVLLAWQVLVTLVHLAEALHVVLVGVVADSPLTIDDEVNLGDVTLFVKNVSVSRVGLEASRHEAKSDLVDEVRVKLFSNVEELAEAFTANDVIEEEVRHDELLDPVGNRIEIIALLKKDLTPVLVPVPAEVALDLLLQVGGDIKAAPMWLVFDAADQVEPLLQFLLILALVLAFELNNDVLELVHEDREESDTEDLDDATENLLQNGLRAIVTIADRG